MKTIGVHFIIKIKIHNICFSHLCIFSIVHHTFLHLNPCQILGMVLRHLLKHNQNLCFQNTQSKVTLISLGSNLQSIWFTKFQEIFGVAALRRLFIYIYSKMWALIYWYNFASFKWSTLRFMQVKKFAEQYTRLKDMGFSSNGVAESLLLFHNDIDQALQHLLTHPS